MRRMKMFAAIILCLLCIPLLTASVVSADKIEVTNEVIPEDSYDSVWLLGLTDGEEIDVSVEVVSPTGALIDVYIMSSSDYLDYPDETFSTEISREGVSTTTFTFTTPDAGSYYLVIDNVDNTRTSDTEPTGSVTVDYEYDDPLEEWTEAAEALAWTCIAIIVVGVIIVIVIIVVIVMVLIKKEKPPQQPQYPPQQPPYQQYPQQPQQPYQPPPQYPPQQPPQQPPGQPPGT